MSNVLTALAVILIAINQISLIKQQNKQNKRIDQLIELLCITEYRCIECAERMSCPAANTGVSFPCEHFRKEDPDGNQE